MKKRLVYAYRWTMWNVLSRLFVRFWLKPKYRFYKSPHSEALPKPPFIIVANHGTFFDPWIIGCFSRHPFAIMCNDDAFNGSAITRWYLNSIGAFPKKKGAQDFRAMKKTISLLSSGYPVCIFPEGQTSWDGETQLLYKGLEKIVRHSRVPLVMVRIAGNFLTKPWWAEHIRTGRIECLFKVLSPDQAQTLSEHGLFLALKTFLAHNDIKEHADGSIPFSGKGAADGLERFVWTCMHCESEDTLAMSGDVIFCSACGSSWSLNALCRISALRQGIQSFGDLNDWARWHRITVLSRIRNASANDVLTISGGVLMQSAPAGAGFGKTATEAVSGAIVLTREKLTFTDATSHQTMAFLVSDIEDCVIQRKDIFEFRFKDRYWRFAFSGHSPMKWVYYLRYLKGYEKLEKQGFIG
jgi:1-acyl-sn-glycerol-3-phosphate acyltransferase